MKWYTFMVYLGAMSEGFEDTVKAQDEDEAYWKVREKWGNVDIQTVN